MSVILFYLSGTIEDMLENKHIYMLLILFTFKIFIVTCQDIAVDSWAVEILHPDNSSYGSTCQTVGFKVGILISTSLFISLNSLEFCNTYIFKTPQEVPLLPLKTFIEIWSYV